MRKRGKQKNYMKIHGLRVGPSRGPQPVQCVNRNAQPLFFTDLCLFLFAAEKGALS